MEMKFKLFTLSCMLVAALTLTACLSTTGSEGTSPATALPTEILYNENTLVAIYERSIPAVVEVRTVTNDLSGVQDLFPFDFPIPEQIGQGSGFIIDDDGHILTNNHVVEGASEVSVILHDGRSLDTEVVGTDRESDLALLKVDPAELDGISPLILGDSDTAKPGQMAIALGSPLGLEGSITVGVVSGVGRSITSETRRPISRMIQTDAAINPGNSGGPLLNSKGEVIGINTAIQTSGIGFAVPVNTAKSLLPDLLEGGEVKSPWLGISGIAINQELAETLSLPVDSGVYIVGVVPDSPAEEAGLRGSGSDERGRPTFGGDVIKAVDGEAVARVEDLIAYLNEKKPGEKISLSIVRGDESFTIDVTLGEWPENLP
jgi:2-alkenal reductase